MTTTYYRTVDVSGIRFFHREAGPVDAPCCCRVSKVEDTNLPPYLGSEFTN